MQTVNYGEFSEGVHERFAGQRAPMDVSIEMTRRCPLDCLHCYNNLPMGDQAARAQEPGGLTAVDADSGYFSGLEVVKLIEAGIDVCIPNSHTACDLHRGQSDRSGRQSLNKKHEPKGTRLVPSAHQFFDGLPC